MLVENKRGNYSFVKGIAPYSAGVIAQAGFEVVHVRLSRYIRLRAGFDAVEAHLKRAGRPLQAMCGMELRSPKPFSFTGFNQFNAGYIDVLKKWDILFDGMNPVARILRLFKGIMDATMPSSTNIMTRRANWMDLSAGSSIGSRRFHHEALI